MNPDKNRFEALTEAEATEASRQTVENQMKRLLRPNGEPVPEHWSTFQVGETVIVKNYTFRVAYIGETTLLLEPLGPLLVGQAPDEK